MSKNNSGGCCSCIVIIFILLIPIFAIVSILEGENILGSMITLSVIILITILGFKYLPRDKVKKEFDSAKSFFSETQKNSNHQSGNNSESRKQSINHQKIKNAPANEIHFLFEELPEKDKQEEPYQMRNWINIAYDHTIRETGELNER